MTTPRVGIGSISPALSPATSGYSAPISGEDGFAQELDALLARQAPPVEDVADAEDVHFSKHAVARLESRGIELTDSDYNDLSDAIDRLASKNARESLLLMGDTAFIVGVPKRTVITAMTRQEAVGNMFTNIDSTLVVR